MLRGMLLRTTPFPVDEKGRDLSLYANQNFGADKSFHPGGLHKGFFGAYWGNDEFGVLHYALRDESVTLTVPRRSSSEPPPPE